MPGTLAYYSAEGSVEESEPASPTTGPPANFDEVVPGIYRSSFPKMRNFEFLGTLGLKTILYFSYWFVILKTNVEQDASR